MPMITWNHFCTSHWQLNLWSSCLPTVKPTYRFGLMRYLVFALSSSTLTQLLVYLRLCYLIGKQRLPLPRCNFVNVWFCSLLLPHLCFANDPYLPTYLPTYLLTYLPTYLSTYLPTHHLLVFFQPSWCSTSSPSFTSTRTMPRSSITHSLSSATLHPSLELYWQTDTSENLSESYIHVAAALK